jgi:hypothetical protein
MKARSGVRGFLHQSRAAGWALLDEDDPIESAAIWIHGLALSPRKISQTGQ